MAILPPKKRKIEGRLERNGHFALQRGRRRGTPRAKWPFSTSREAENERRPERNGHFRPPEGARSKKCETVEFFILKMGGGVRWTQNGPEVTHLYAGLPQAEGSRNFPAFARFPPRRPRRGHFGERLDRNGHFGLRRRPKTTNAPSEMAIFERKRAENETRPERNGHSALPKGPNRQTPRAKWPFCPPESSKSTDASSEMGYILYTIYYILYTTYYILHATYYILYTV